MSEHVIHEILEFRRKEILGFSSGVSGPEGIMFVDGQQFIVWVFGVGFTEGGSSGEDDKKDNSRCE